MGISFQSAFDSFIAFVLALFPTSPFTNISLTLTNLEWLKWLNWFFPVGQCLTVMALWTAAIGVYYAYSIVARWVKIIS